ncbi:hypothetical protein I6J22_03715 [Corynebacterium kroppenstedtii]|uniref:Putative secreted protein n=1 Tax=Corynebacterium kroppenstedtii (strain DSM 44385 / JCM 11950 / CIP 105744 / CCUG 35717) TaxID=645127 RepID=C4LHM0_CORK4|nr:hypothetical protein [Corynebacterium kroppenstedtii]ACR17325.1 putative secreted protein [Corynebacterium kroppenstedtii DSM 44385]QRP11183.1 hypothetical protein I6J22_03715 [Corynebacterium kroppenstedtii]
MRKQLVGATLTALVVALPLTACTSQNTAQTAEEAASTATTALPSTTSPGSDTPTSEQDNPKKETQTSQNKADNVDKHSDSHKQENNKTAQNHAQQPSTGQHATQKKTVETQAAGFHKAPPATQTTDNSGSTYQPEDIEPGETPTMQRHMHLKPEDIDPDLANYTGPTYGVTNVTEGAYCTNYGAGSTGTTADEKNLVCIVRVGEENPQWSPY